MKAGWIVLSCLALTACASRPSASGAATAAAADGSVLLGAIADSGLPKGDCGMVLWTLEQERPSPIFRYLAGKSAEIVVNGKNVLLTLVEAKGSSAFGVSETQTFAGLEGLTVTVNVHFSVGFDGGSYLERGLVTAGTPEGWRTVAPSAGIAGCRAK